MSGPMVLVPLDGSKNALCALPVARRLADLGKASIRILHVTAEVGPPSQSAEALGLEPADLRGATLEVRAGGQAAAILEAAAEREASLIVMCRHAPDVPPTDAISPAALAVLRGAHCPVVLVNPTRTPGDWAPRRVLAPHDGSPAVSDALKPAAELAHQAGAELVVLQVADDTRDLDSGSIAPPVYVDQFQHSWPAWSGEFLQRLTSVCPLADVSVRLRLAHGEPAGETIRAAREESADLIALAWKGHWGAPHAPTLKAVLNDAPCPVMVTRVPAA